MFKYVSFLVSFFTNKYFKTFDNRISYELKRNKNIWLMLGGGAFCKIERELKWSNEKRRREGRQNAWKQGSRFLSPGIASERNKFIS